MVGFCAQAKLTAQLQLFCLPLLIASRIGTSSISN